MKKALAFLLVLTLCFFAAISYAYNAEDAYYDFKEEHGSFVKSITDSGITEETLISFIEDVYSYIKEIHAATGITEDNFESNALTAITRVSARTAYQPLQDALLILYPDSIRMAVSDGTVSSEFRPLVDTIKRIFFSNNMLGSSGSNNGNNGNDGNGGNAGNGGNDSGASGDSDTASGNSNESGASSPSTPSQEPDVSRFTDIDQSHWAYTAVSSLAENFVLNGYLDGTFRPDANITRAEFAKIIVSATDSYDIDALSSFSDVSSNAWYYAYISSAYKKGYITGYPDGTFAPDANITRADICTIVYRCIKDSLSSGTSAVPFSDDSAIPDYAKSAVYALAGKNIVNGLGDGTFAPTAFATRAQTAKIVYQSVFVK